MADDTNDMEMRKLGMASAGCLNLIKTLLEIVALVLAISLMVSVMVQPQKYTGAAQGVAQLRHYDCEQHDNERGEEDDKLQESFYAGYGETGE